MKKLWIVLVASFFMLGLAGCDLINPQDIPQVCDDGFELVGTDCVPIATEGDAPVITLTGDATVTLAVGDTYTDAGASATDTEDGDLTTSIVVDNPVDTSVEGTYTITYDVTDSDGQAATQVTRTVIVVVPGDNDPILTLIGDVTVSINAGDAYNDQGATATDLEDGDLTSNIDVTSNVDTAVAGTYTVTYEVEDADGNLVAITRTVIVLPSDAEVLANYIVDNWDGTLQFLGLTMANMDFSEAMNLTFEVEFELAEDVDETRSVSATVTDQYLYGEDGTTMHRYMHVNVDDEMELEINIIVEEVETGVHLYIEYRPVLEMVAMQAPEVLDMASWVGFDDEWALFQLDDSLENVVEVAVVKDMLVSLFFSEMGENFFYDTQEQLIEEAIGFDLTQYGVDLGQFVDYLIEEDFDAAELLLQGIDAEAILLHVDHMYIAWNLYEFFMMYETELLDDGFDTTKLELLNTATYNETTGEMEVNLPIDPLEGTQAFFESLTEDEIMSIVEIIIKPAFEESIYQGLLDEVGSDWLNSDFESMLNQYADFFEQNWPESSAPFVLADELAELQAADALTYWRSLTMEEQDVFFWAIDDHYVGWSVWNLRDFDERNGDFFQAFYRHREEYDYYNISNELMTFIYDADNVQYLFDTYGFDPVNWYSTIEDIGMLEWFFQLPMEEQNMFYDLLSQPGNEGYNDVLSQFLHMSENPWEYQWWYEFDTDYGKQSIGVDHATWTLEELMRNNETFLTDERGFDVDAVITEMYSYEHKGIEWYMYYATDDQRDALHEVADFEWEDRYQWTLEQLDELMYGEWGYYTFFGRNEEIQDLDNLSYEIQDLLWSNEGYLMDTYGINASDWTNAIMNDGLTYWYTDILSEADRAILTEISEMNDGWNRWPVQVLEMWYNGEEFSLQWCNWGWNWCMDESSITEDLVQLIQNNEGYLNDMGYDVPALVAQIQQEGALRWYTEFADEADRDVLMEIAEWADWQREMLYLLDDLDYKEADLLHLLEVHETELNTLGFDATGAIAFLDTNGYQAFVTDFLTEADVELLMDALLYPEVDLLLQAIEDQEVAEFIVDFIFNNPHYDLVLDELVPTEDMDLFDLLDVDNLQATMLALDFDALVMENVDLEALATAIYEGPVAYDTFVTDLQATAPGAASILALFAPSVEQLQPLMVFVDDFNYAFEGLSVFEHFFTPEYWLDESGMDIELEVTDDLYVQTSMGMTSIMYQLVLDDLFTDLNTYLSGFQTLPFPYDENWDCLDPLDDNCDNLELANLMAILTQFGDIGINATFDPSDPTWMQLQLDATDFLDVVAYKSNEWILDDPEYTPDNDNDIITGVNVATFTVTMSEGGTITMPAEEDVDNVNEIAYEAAKFSVAMFARDYLRELLWHYDEFPQELQDLITSGSASYSLNDFDFIRKSQAFDNDMSTIDITVDLTNPLDPVVTFGLTLYWIDGTEALDGTITLEEFQANFDDFNDLTSQAAWDAMVGIVNDDNFNLTKLWLMLLLQDEDHDKYQDDYR